MTVSVASQKGKTEIFMRCGEGVWFKARWRDLIRLRQICGTIVLRLLDT